MDMETISVGDLFSYGNLLFIHLLVKDIMRDYFKNNPSIKCTLQEETQKHILVFWFMCISWSLIEYSYKHDIIYVYLIFVFLFWGPIMLYINKKLNSNG